MAENFNEERGRLVTISTPKGRAIYLECKPPEHAVSMLAEEAGKTGKPEGSAFSSILRNYRRGGILSRGQESVLALSLLLKPPMHVSRSGVIGMLASLAACQVLEQASLLRPQIEQNREIWSGDIRLCAISLSGSLLPNGFWNYLVLDTTFSLEEEYYKENLSNIVQRVFSNRPAELGDRIAEEFLSNFFSLYETCSTDASFAAEYNKRIGYKGKKIHATHQGTPIKGRLQGMTENGQFLLELKGGETLSVSADNVIY